MPRWKQWTVAVAAAVVGAVGVGYYWRHERLFPSTDDAYVQANVVRIAPRVSGTVAVVHVRNFERVSAGQPLVEIERRPFELALDAAQARLDAVLQEVAVAEAGVAIAEAGVAQRRAELEQAQNDARRLDALARRQAVSPAQREQADEALKSAQAQLLAAQSNLETARRHLGERGNRNARVRAARSAVESARLDLDYTLLRAPAEGIVAEVTVRPGTTVQQEIPLFALVENGHWWVDANYEETDLKRIEPGLPARISLDMYPHYEFRGVVESISPASGVAFSLLPPENATGNWVKVTQRFPVRVAITETDPDRPLRVGASATVTIDTTAQPLPQAPRRP